MALLQRSIFNPESGFTPLFRLLDDFDAYTRGNEAGEVGQLRPGRHFQDFQPKFDVREVADAYELHGELPGLSKENVNIEFTDPQTLRIRGRVERSYSAGSPPAGLLESTKTGGAIAESSETEHGKSATDEVTKTSSTDNKQQKKSGEKATYWVSERSVGEFSRVFSFPHAVQQDGVTANLKDGILNLRVPKTNKPQTRRIDIN